MSNQSTPQAVVQKTKAFAIAIPMMRTMTTTMAMRLCISQAALEGLAHP